MRTIKFKQGHDEPKGKTSTLHYRKDAAYPVEDEMADRLVGLGIAEEEVARPSEVSEETGTTLGTSRRGGGGRRKAE